MLRAPTKAHAAKLLESHRKISSEQASSFSGCQSCVPLGQSGHGSQQLLLELPLHDLLPIFQLSASMSPFFVKLDHLGVSEALDPSLVERFNAPHRCCISAASRCCIVLEQIVRCPVARSLVDDDLKVVREVAHSDLHVCRITSHSSVACSMVTARLDGGTAASGQSGKYKPKCESFDQPPITQHLRESLSTGMWFDHLASSCLQLLISVGLEAVHVAVCGIGDCKTAVHQVSVDLFHHSCGLLTHLQRAEGRLSGQIAPFTRNMWSFDIGKVVASSKCGASCSAISKASLLLHHMVHKVHGHSHRHRPCGVLGDSKRFGRS